MSKRLGRQYCSVTKGIGATLVVMFMLVMAPSALADLEITEIMYNPISSGDAVWEWIEVRNTSGAPIDLDGYVSSNLNAEQPSSINPAIDSTLASNTVIGAGKVAVIYDGTQSASSGFPNYDDASFRQAWGLSESVPVLAARSLPGLSNVTGSDNQSVAFWPDEATYLLDVESVEDDPEGEPGVFTDRVTSFTNAAFSIDYSAGFPTVGNPGGRSITWTGSGADNQSGANWVESEAGTNSAVTSTAVELSGPINSTNDIGNPGIAPSGAPSTTGLHITEILYDSAGDDPDWEWVEVYNSTNAPINLAGGVIDDNNSIAHSASNIATGTVPAGSTAILYNGDQVSEADFKAAWGAGLNVIAASGWTTSRMGLNNGNDKIGIWANFGSYDGDNVTQTNALVSQAYNEDAGFTTSPGGPSISLNGLNLDPTDGANWTVASVGDDNGSFKASEVTATVTFHPGGDVASPGTFVPVTTADVDLDNDGDIDGADFLLIQQNNSALIPDWHAQYGGGGLAAVMVPEPTAVALFGVALFCLSVTRRS